MLTISKLKRWSINYYIDTATTAEHAAGDLARAGGGLGEYYSERETRTPAWLLAGDAHTTAALVGLTDGQRAGDDADAALVARWLDEGIAPNGAHGRAFGERGVHGFDLTFCSPKSVSLVRVLRTDDVVAKAIADAHTTALSEAMEYLAAHAGYTRVHNPRTGEKDLVRLPGLVAVAYQHETSRCGDSHLHTHVIVPNRQARADGNSCQSTARRCITKPRLPASSIRPPCAANCTNPWDSSGRRWTPRPGWPSWPAWTATPSPPGRGAPPSCASGLPTTSRALLTFSWGGVTRIRGAPCAHTCACWPVHGGNRMWSGLVGRRGPNPSAPAGLGRGVGLRRGPSRCRRVTTGHPSTRDYQSLDQPAPYVAAAVAQLRADDESRQLP